jgi:hypothetical protein
VALLSRSPVAGAYGEGSVLGWRTWPQEGRVTRALVGQVPLTSLVGLPHELVTT